MRRRWGVVGMCGLAVAALVLAGLAYRGKTPLRCLAVRDVPAVAQRDAQDALAAAGVNVLAEPVWAGVEADWQVPATYRLYFAAADEDAAVEVYAAEARVDGGGNVASVTGIRALTRTPAGEETAPGCLCLCPAVRASAVGLAERIWDRPHSAGHHGQRHRRGETGGRSTRQAR